MAEKAETETQQTGSANTKPDKYFADQFDDESVIFVFHKHPIVMRKGLVLGLLGPLLGIIPAGLKPELGFGYFFGGLAAGCLAGLILFAPSWIGWHFSVFIITDQRFIQITQKGLFHRAVADITLNQIQSINYEVSGLQETLLGFGTIRMQTYVGDLVIHDVHHPAKIQKKLLSILREEGINTNPYTGSSTSGQSQAHEETEETQEA
jgi:uncharacterized membrane protein YdbT with pleckstrin-like domain